jgi:hypothetical protein
MQRHGGRAYDMGYYLADETYLVLSTLMKTTVTPRGKKIIYFVKAHET